jgi:hypothetical protein
MMGGNCEQLDSCSAFAGRHCAVATTMTTGRMRSKDLESGIFKHTD